jgi:hypothetical protein
MAFLKDIINNLCKSGLLHFTGTINVIRGLLKNKSILTSRRCEKLDHRLGLLDRVLEHV